MTPNTGFRGGSNPSSVSWFSRTPARIGLIHLFLYMISTTSRYYYSLTLHTYKPSFFIIKPEFFIETFSIQLYAYFFIKYWVLSKCSKLFQKPVNSCYQIQPLPPFLIHIHIEKNNNSLSLVRFSEWFGGRQGGGMGKWWHEIQPLFTFGQDKPPTLQTIILETISIVPNKTARCLHYKTISLYKTTKFFLTNYF